MRRNIVTAWLLLAAAFVLPVLLIRGAGSLQSERPGTGLLPLQQPQTDRWDVKQPVNVLGEDGTVTTLGLDAYLWGVVAAEMPAAFELEALKAQSVAARTYWACQRGTGRHVGADICTDSACCQAYISRTQAAENWGERAAEYTQRIEMAVSGTDGQCVTYQGVPIQAVFFSSAPGSTVDAEAVWGKAVPYLVSVDSPEGDKVPNYHSELTMTTGEFRALVAQQYPQADLSGPVSGWLSNFVWEPSGTVRQVTVGGISMAGGQVRKLLGLRSACFSVSVTGENMTFHVTGYGHGVGMSQYGANELAAQGKTFREILAWYYTGAQVEPLQ